MVDGCFLTFIYFYFDCHLSEPGYMEINCSLFSFLGISKVTNGHTRDIPHIGHTLSVYSEEVKVTVILK